MKSLNKDFLRCLSLANLWFFPVWYNLIETPFNVKYYQLTTAFISINPFLSAVLNVLFFTFLFWSGIKLIRRLNNRFVFKISQFMFIGLFSILTLSIIRVLSDDGFGLGALFFSIANKIGINLSLGITILFVLFAIIVWKNKIILIIKSFLLIMAPFVLITFLQAGINGATYDAEKLILHETPVAYKLPTSQKRTPNVLWIVFDEMGWHMTFGERLPILQLPELDRFKNEAIYANNAYPPAGGTDCSMPSYITGKLISMATPVNGDLMIKFGESKDTVKWSEQASVFSKARELGFNTAMVGWYHPYGRILKNSLITYSGPPIFGTIGILETMYEQCKQLFFKIPLLNSSAIKQTYLIFYIKEMENAKKLAIDQELNLTLMHFSIPHHPTIYNRFDGKFTTLPNASYLDNLALADKTLGELRLTMESAGVWDDTTVIITSDHYWRSGWFQVPNRSKEDFLVFKRDGRIPFLIKLAGQKNHVIYEKEFNTVITHDLVLAILRQEVTTTDDVVNWLDQHNEIGESPYIPEEYKKSKNGE